MLEYIVTWASPGTYLSLPSEEEEREISVYADSLIEAAQMIQDLYPEADIFHVRRV